MPVQFKVNEYIRKSLPPFAKGDYSCRPAVCSLAFEIFKKKNEGSGIGRYSGLPANTTKGYYLRKEFAPFAPCGSKFFLKEWPPMRTKAKYFQVRNCGGSVSVSLKFYRYMYVAVTPIFALFLALGGSPGSSASATSASVTRLGPICRKR